MSQSYDQILTAFANHVGLAPAELLSTQEIVIDGLPIGLQLDGDEAVGDLIFFVVLGTPDATQFNRIARTMLEANNFWVGTGGCTLGVQRDSGAVTLCGRVALDDLTGESLAALLDGFVDTATFWNNLTARGDHGADRLELFRAERLDRRLAPAVEQIEPLADANHLGLGKTRIDQDLVRHRSASSTT